MKRWKAIVGVLGLMLAAGIAGYCSRPPSQGQGSTAQGEGVSKPTRTYAEVYRLPNGAVVGLELPISESFTEDDARKAIRAQVEADYPGAVLDQ